VYKNKSLSRKQKDSITIIIIGILIGLLYPTLDREFNDLGKMLNGPIIGFICSSFLVLNEIWYKRPIFRHMKFITVLVYKSVLYSTFYVLTIVFVISLQRAIENNTNLISFMGSDAFYNLIFKEDLYLIVIYGLTANVVFILVYQISRKMGQGVLWNFIIGKYHRAREEERIFMFMDLNNSTEIAEGLGDIAYNKLLNDFFFDITDSIIENYGEIYRYVGDEVVVSWKLKKGLPNAYFLRAFFQAKRVIHNQREKYLESYGLVPSFTAGFNYGKVIVGEIGEVKSQICFFGDVLYETAKLEKSCKKYSTDNLVAKSLLNLVAMPLIFTVKDEGRVEIEDFEPIDVSSVTEK